MDGKHPEDRESFEHALARSFEKQERLNWEGRLVVRGKTMWVTVEAIPRQRAGSTVWEGVTTDITGRKAAEEQIARSETALRNALDTLPFAVGLCVASDSHADLAARIVFLNRNFIATFGYELSDLPTAADWARLAYPGKDYRREVFAWWDSAVRRLMAGESQFEEHESGVTGKDGRTFDLLVSATTLEDKLVVSFLDITDRKKAERREREMAEAHRLELRQKLKTALAASAISHEIKQPLSRIIHTADLLRLDAAEALAGQPKFAALVRELSTDARLTSETIQKMGNLLRNVKTAHTRFDLAECVRNAVLANTAKWRLAGLDLVLDEPKGTFPIHGDETQIALALGNLFDNAAQAMAAHPGPLTPEILVQMFRRRRHFEIRIGDSGPGIPETDIADLLLRSTKAEGTGLGLFIVQTTLENHGGHLEIGRSPLGGAEMRLFFPKAPTGGRMQAQN